MTENQEINLFKEARLQAGLCIEGAALVTNDPKCNWESIKAMEAKSLREFKMPQWGWKYLSALREITWENSRL